MKIAHIIPHSVSFPLSAHNGRYDWVYQLATRQARQGHSVTVYGGEHSFIENVKTESISELSPDKKQNNIETFRLAFSHEHDVYHSHFDTLHYEVAHETQRPIIYTQHWWPTDETIEAAKEYAPGNVWAVPPTKYMFNQDMLVGIQSKGYIYHGIDLDMYHSSNSTKSDQILFVGRISPEKNLDLAIKVIVASGARLSIIGKVAAKQQAYWQSLQPLIDGEQIQYLGTKTPHELVEHYASARAVLFPSDIKETFGLVAIEAQACGTPVIMKRGGSRGELIIENKTGFLCNNEAEFISAIQSVDTLKSEDCIAFSKSFDIVSMVAHYEQLYKDLTTS